MAKFVVIVSMLVHFGIICASETPDIIRGESDKFSKDYYRVENIKSCGSDGYCTCPKNSNTFIYDSNKPPPGKCVKDQNINNKDLSGGKFLAEGDKCLGVSEHGEIKNLTCNKTDASVLWLWTDEEYMLNLRTLKCLELYNKTKLILKQCRKHETNQRWRFLDDRTVENVIVTEYKKKWLRPSNLSLYYTGEGTPSYKGCYRFSDGRFMHLVNKSDCGTSCSLDLTIRAPIMSDINKIAKCTLDMEYSYHSIDGQTWTKFASPIKGVSVDTKSPEQISLKIENKSSLLENWPGRLIKIGIKCEAKSSNEYHCILLKIAGPTKAQTTTPSYKPSRTSSTPPTSSTVSPITPSYKPSRTSSTPPASTTVSPTTPSYKPSRTSSTPPASTTVSHITANSSSPIIVVVPVVVSICLLLVAVGIILFYRRRKRSRIKEDSHLYEESNPSGDMRTRNSAQPNELHGSPNDYQYVGGNIYSQATYADPNSTISTQPNPRSNQELSYDYATREVTPMIPLILAGDNILDDGTSGSPSQQPAKVLGPNANDGVDREVRKGTLNDKPIYHTVEDEGDNAGTGEDSKGQEGTFNDKPIYHTVEDEGDNAGTAEDREEHKVTLNDKPIYHTLENEGDNAGTGEDREEHKGILNDKPIYHTLENEGDNAGTGEDREEHKGTLNDKPIYHTLENNDAT